VHLLGGYMGGLNAEIGRLAIEAMAVSPRPKSPMMSCFITFPVLGGALFDKEEDSAAFSRVGAEWLFEVAVAWDSRADDAEYSTWVDETMAVFDPFLASNAYVNLTGDRGPEWLRGAYGSAEKWNRIVELKRTWDPENRFSYNKNVTP